ncbi:UNVERIFIED_CONTAM: hypothetical protein RMT77_012436 [Armadillidium vulgare]
MILRRQRASVYESKAKKEENSPLEKRNELNKEEVKMPIKASIKKTSRDENEKTFHTEDENTNNEKLSLKLDSVKRISKFFEKDSSRNLESPKINNKVDEKEISAKRFEINASPTFKEKIKTYQSLLQSTEDTKKKVFQKKNSQTIITNNSSGEKSPSPDIISDLLKPKLLPTVEIKEITNDIKEKENSSLKQKEETEVPDVQVNENLQSNDNVNTSDHFKKEEKVSVIKNDVTTSNEFKEKLKVYQSLVQNSEGKKQTVSKNKKSEASVLPDKIIANPEVIPTLSQLKELSVVEIDEKINTTSTEHRDKNTSTKSVETQTVSTLNDLQEKEKADTPNSTLNIAINNKQPEKDNLTNNDSTTSHNFKEKLKAYQMLVQNSDVKNRNYLKKQNSKTTLINNNLTEEKLEKSQIISSPSKVEQTSTVEANDKTERNDEKSSLKQEAIISLATIELQTNEKTNESNNVSNISVHTKLSEKDPIINNETAVSQKENNDENNDKHLHQNSLQRDKSLFESRAASVKLIINQYQTNIQSNNVSKGKNKTVLTKKTSQTKFLVTKISEDDLIQANKKMDEEVKNITVKTKGMDDLNINPQSNLDNNTPSSESASVRIKKEVKFLRKDTEEQLLESEKPKTVKNAEDGEPNDINLIQKKELEMISSAPEKENEEDQPTSSIKDIIRKAKMDAEKQQNAKNNENKKAIKKIPVTSSNKSTKENKVDLNEELKKTFKSRTFNNQVVSNDNFDEETTDNLNKNLESEIQKDQKNDSKNSKVFKYIIGQKSEEEVITDWTPVNEVMIKTNEEVMKDKKMSENSKPIYKFSDSELQEITYKNTRMNAKTTTELKGILKGSKPQNNSLKENSVSSVGQTKKEEEIENENFRTGDDNNNNDKKNTANLEKFIAKHLEKQLQTGNTVELSKQPPSKNAKHGASRVKPTNRPIASEYFNNVESKSVPNGTIINSKSEQAYPEPDYD